MAQIGFPLTGVDPLDPTPGDVREFRFAQNPNGGNGTERSVLLLGNKTSDGSEAADTLSTDPILDLNDCIARFGRRSEFTWMYRLFIAVPQNATIWGIAPAENGAATQATVEFTFATTATDTTNLIVQWGDYKLTVPVASGDTAIVQADNVATAMVDWEEGTMPFTAAQEAPANDHKVLVTAANGGTRGGLPLNGLRMYYQKNVSTTVSKGAVTAGTGEDDFTTAYSLIETSGPFYYIVNAKYSTSSPTATDNGMGEGAALISTLALPNPGFGQQMIFGFVGTVSELTTVATGLNNVRCKVWWLENNPWPPSMIAAHAAAIQRQQETTIHPCFNLKDYGPSDTRVCLFTPPYSASDKPTATEIKTALNNGGSVIVFNNRGVPSIKRCVTTRSLNGAVNDYRAREGHIPSGLDYAWDNVFFPRWQATVQPFIASDPVQGQKPLGSVQYPNASVELMRNVIIDLIGPFFGGAPILDPSPDVVLKMLASVQVLELADGTSMKADLAVVRHNLKGQFLINETSPAY